MTTSLFKEYPYYHQTIKKLIVAFGSLFTDITLTRQVAGNKSQVVRVPISYGPRNKWLSRLREDPDFVNNVEITLPRISFEITDYRYDAARKIGQRSNYTLGTINDARAKIYNPVPYDVTIQMHSMCKNQEDSLQILEQVLPYFAPSLDVSVEVIPEFNITKTIPITLQGVAVDDSYDGSPEQFRVVIQTFTLVAQLDLFGPIIMNNKVIKQSIANVGDTEPHTEDKYQATVNPFTANKTDEYTVDEAWLKNF